MAEMTNNALTNDRLVAFCKAMLGQPYWYGTAVYKCTNSLLTRKTKQYPSHYGSNRTAQYKQNIAKKQVCADCIGLIKGFAWTNGGVGVIESIGTDKTYTSKYGGNGCPDKSANGMFTYAKDKGAAWGTMDSMPELPGIAVRYDGHVGVYIGDGYVIEERGFAYGCVKTRLKDRKWTNWYQFPFISYGTDSVTPPVQDDYPLGSRLLKRGMSGSDVKALQELLMDLGYELPKYGADGDYGAETEAAVKAFQKAHKLTADGIFGDKTYKALMEAVGDNDDDITPEPEAPDAEIADAKVIIVSNGGKVNVRVGNGTEYASITHLAPGTICPFVATAANGWHAIVINAQVGWVSGQYSNVLLPDANAADAE